MNFGSRWWPVRRRSSLTTSFTVAVLPVPGMPERYSAECAPLRAMADARKSRICVMEQGE